MEFKEEEVVTKKSTIDVQSGEVHKVIEKDNTVSVVFQEEKNDVLIKCVLNLTKDQLAHINSCLLYTSPSPRDRVRSRMPSSA